MRLGILAIGMAVALSACETTGPIDESQSMLAVNMADGKLPAITREVTKVGDVREEVWDWPSATLRIVRSGRGSYFSEDFAEFGEFARSVRRWPPAVRTDVSAHRVRTGQNVIGDFQYAIGEKFSRTCFYMLQGIPFSRPPRFLPVHTPESSSGFIAFYQCAAKNSTTPAELEAEGLAFATALARNW